MAAVGVGDKYDVSLDGQGFLLGGRYQKMPADSFVPRFNTGEEGLTDLDLMKVWQQTDFSGGAFQDIFDDQTRVKILSKLLMHPDNKRLYPVSAINDLGSSSLDDSTEAVPVHYAIYRGELYAAMKDKVYKWNRSTQAWGTSKDFADTTVITGLEVGGDYLWCATGGTLNQYWYYNNSAWAQATLTTGATHIRTMNQWVYYTGSGANGRLYRRNFVATGSGARKQEIGVVGAKDNYINSLGVFNYKLMIGTAMGLFAYDEVRISTVVDMTRSFSQFNCESMTEFQGAWYYTVGKALFRFTGSTVEKITVFEDEISSLNADANRLYIGLLNGELHVFDGVGFAMFQDFGARIKQIFPVGLDLASTAAPGEGQLNTEFPRYLLVAPYGDPAKTVNLGDLFNKGEAAGDGTMYVETSEIDSGLPNVKKRVDSVTVNYLDLISGDSLTVKVRAFNDNAWGAWKTLATDSTASVFMIDDAEDAFDGVFERLQVRVEMEIASRTNEPLISIKAVAIDYYLLPKPRWEWRMRVRCEGQSDAKMELKDDAQSEESATARELREAVYAAVQATAPVGFEDIDFTLLNGAVDNNDDPITLDTTAGLKAAGYIKVDDEVIGYTGKTVTQLTGLIRGALGTSAAAHDDNAIVTPYYRVVATLEPPGESIDEPSRDDYGTQSIMEVRLREV